MYRACWVIAGFAFAVLTLGLAVAQQPAPAVAPGALAPAQARPDQVITGLDGPGLAVVYDEDAGILAAGCDHGTIQYWNKDVVMGVRAGSGTPHVLHAHQGPVTALVWRGSVLASAGADRKILLWTMPDGQTLHTFEASASVRALALSPDGRLLAAGCDSGAIEIWDVATARLGGRLDGHTDWVAALAFTADGKQLASGGFDGTVRLWDMATGKPALEIPARPMLSASTTGNPVSAVLCLAFSRDGKMLAIGGTDAQIHLVNPADGKLIRSLAGHTSSITSLAFHPTASLLVSSSKDRTIKLWDPANVQAVKSLDGHTAWALGVVFVDHGNRLASVGADQTMRLWDLTAPRK